MPAANFVRYHISPEHCIGVPRFFMVATNDIPPETSCELLEKQTKMEKGTVARPIVPICLRLPSPISDSAVPDGR